MLNLGELVNQIAVLAQRSEDTNYKTNIKAWVNFAQRYIYNLYDYWAELEEIHNFSTADGTESYYMPNVFDKPFMIKDLTNKKDVTIITEQEYIDGNLDPYVDLTEETAPQFARLYGVSPVTTQISTSGDTVKAKSSATETTSGTVRVEGYVDSSLTIVDYENITVSGTSFATASSPKTFYKILSASKSTDSVGYFTIANSSSTTLGVIPSNERTVTHKVLKLGKIPNRTNSMRVWYKRKMRRLVNDGDYPFVDADDFFIVYAYAMALSEGKESQVATDKMFSQATEILKVLLNNQQRRLGDTYQHKIVPSISLAHRS